MRSNTRLLIRSLKNVITVNNPVIAIFVHLKKVIDLYSELPRKSHNISSIIHENKALLEKTRSVMERDSRTVQSSSINLVR